MRTKFFPINLECYVIIEKMSTKKPADKPAKKPDREDAEAPLDDYCETVGLMEPMCVGEDSRLRGELSELAFELGTKSARFKAMLPQESVASLAELVRAMNCYYSNLIEGHNTHPIDIERALKGDYSNNPETRDLQLEAKAHINVQRWLDSGVLNERLTEPDAVRQIHKRFCEELPDSLLRVTDPKTGASERVVPGEYRRGHVQVGAHIPVSPGAVPRFMVRFNDAYRRLRRSERVIATAGAHHRLLWIHPFADGNGRVARLMSHAMLVEALDTGALWSVARGLARNSERYKSHLAACDQGRRNELDGRGTLSEETLASFSKFFLEVCMDQVDFMEGLMQPKTFRDRVLRWVNNEIDAGDLPKRAGVIVDAVLHRGALPRAELEPLLGVADRTARRIASALLERGVLKAETHKADLKLAFTVGIAKEWMPDLFPEA